MLTYLSQYHNISKVTDDLKIPERYVPGMSKWDRDTLAEIITVLYELRCLARQLEADRKVAISRDPHLLRELYETLFVISRDIVVTRGMFYDAANRSEFLDETRQYLLMGSHFTSREIPRVADHCHKRDIVRSERLHMQEIHDIAKGLAKTVHDRFQKVWKHVHSDVIW